MEYFAKDGDIWIRKNGVEWLYAPVGNDSEAVELANSFNELGKALKACEPKNTRLADDWRE